MRTSSILILTATALAQLALANWTPEKAAQINFYTDAHCTQYNGEVPAWWLKSPLVGGIGSVAGAARAQCITLNMPGNSASINTAGLWGYSTTTQPGIASGHCTFYDDFTCGGNQATAYYGTGSALPTCQPARSKDGWLWKSAKCWIN
ncbi:hypothetical protein C8J57DRAFT_1505649 [Mycena rebaudengoi]|jgi:hypothetical protein|nr:hypothetical protein C8J57DRAFT_1505649 [Mycena rebaudengoi]